ncbi:MAG: PAC2 family protein [Thermoleophilia bacterium]
MDPVHWDEPAPRLRDAVMVAAFGGWNDAASAASSALGFLGTSLGARKVASIDAEEFYDFQATRPLVDMSGGATERIVWPDVEIRVAQRPDWSHDVVLVSGAEPSFRWRTFCRVLLDAGDRLGVTRAVTLGSLLADVVHNRAIRLTGMSSDPELIADLGFREPTYSGPTGIVGVLQQAAIDRGFGAVSLWAPVSHYAAGLTNAKGSLALIEGLGRIKGIDVDVDVTELRAAAGAFEDQVDRAVAAEPRLKSLVEQLEQAAGADHGPLPTGDELAEELERYLRERDEPS